MRLLRRYWWAAPLVLAALAVGGIALGPRLQDSTTSAPVRCGPPPCSAPDGFEVDVSAIHSEGGLTSLQVSFKNQTAPGFGAGNYRPTSPADFELDLGFGRRLRPVFAAPCSDWREIHVVRGKSAGPETLCFATASAVGTRLIWSPDLGILFHEVRIPLQP